MFLSARKHARCEGNINQPSNDDIDRISKLPESILSHILSLLPTTKEAVATSVLSTNWKYLWKDIHNLSFHMRETPNLTETEKIVATNSFVLFVNNIMRSLNKQPIEKFSLSINEIFDVEPWIAAAVARDVKVVEFVIEDDDDENDIEDLEFQLPSSLFTCKTLEVLYLVSRINLNLPSSVSLPNLKTLILRMVIYESDESVSKLISGCSSLETLTVVRNRYDNVKTFTISSSTLRFLMLNFNDGDDMFPNEFEYKLEINAPQLRCLYLLDSLSKDFSVDNLCLLDDARIHIDGSSSDLYPNPVVKLLQGFYNVKNLSLTTSISALKAITHESEYTTSFPRLSRLRLETTCPEFLLTFFEGAPKLEFVELDKYYHKRIHENCWSKPENVPVCILSSLKTISIRGLITWDEEIPMIAYILNNAKNLKIMTIYPHNSLDLKSRMQLLVDVSKFPRGSTECELNFLQCD